MSQRRPIMTLVIAVLAVFGASVGAAHANPRYAAIVMHADTGDVLFSRHADAARYPASITKVMTLYMLFEALEAGEVELTDTFTVSKRAAGQPPSKLGVRRGEQLPVETAIYALVVRSANDVATVVAEGLAGSEYKFAKKMTSKARALGMKRTTFQNASGLPHKYQRTTARDLATLSMRMAQDFPDMYHYFGAKSFPYRGKTYRTHNRVLLNYKGADGLKTGYTRASGFNLATTARKGENRLIGVVMGGKSSYSRDNHMRQILDKSFARLGRSPSLLRRAYVARPKPRMKPTLLASGETVETPVIATLFTPDLSPKRKQALAILDPQIGALGDRLGAVGGEPGGEDLIGRLIERTDYFHSLTKTLAEVDGDLAQGDAEADQPTAAIAPDARWSVQIGAYNSAELAAQKLRKVAERTGGDIAEAPWAVAPAKRRGATLFRARFTGFERVDAESHCLRIKSKGFDCFAIKEGSPSNS